MANNQSNEGYLEESPIQNRQASQLTSLFHIQIPVKDLDQSVRWYQANLGFALKDHYGTSAFLALPAGPLLMLWETEDDTSATFSVNGQEMPVLLFATDDIQSIYEQLNKSKAEITHFQQEGFGWVLKFFDPSRNLWGVIQEKGKNRTK
ncbi:VOC family protein [Brevibacillus fluminis]|uniref:VOC family protein n=1 Tax=Brevibacillus fluminis TaxID=511487 RepID=A0A3M8D6P9_9BACL|nr:VOC family protein [Brevibacillus fluminis]RNB83389.1 VOC family protein [Brevibacillus fluminis]